MDGKSGFRPAGDREMYAFKFSLLRACLRFLRSFWRIFNHPRVECALMHDTCVLKFLKCINAVKFYRILRFLNLNLARRI